MFKYGAEDYKVLPNCLDIHRSLLCWTVCSLYVFHQVYILESTGHIRLFWNHWSLTEMARYHLLFTQVVLCSIKTTSLHRWYTVLYASLVHQARQTRPNSGEVGEGHPRFDKGGVAFFTFYALKIELFRVFTLSD